MKKITTLLFLGFITSYSIADTRDVTFENNMNNINYQVYYNSDDGKKIGKTSGSVLKDKPITINLNYSKTDEGYLKFKIMSTGRKSEVKYECQGIPTIVPPYKAVFIISSDGSYTGNFLNFTCEKKNGGFKP